MRRLIPITVCLLPLVGCVQPAEPTFTVWFPAGTARLDARAVENVNAAARFARHYPQNLVYVTVYEDEFNKVVGAAQLSQARGNAVAAMLGRQGVASPRVRFETTGPVDFNNLPNESRRVEVTVVGEE